MNDHCVCVGCDLTSMGAGQGKWNYSKYAVLSEAVAAVLRLDCLLT